MKKLLLSFMFALVALFVFNSNVLGQSANCQIDLSTSWAITPNWDSFDPVVTTVCVGGTVEFNVVFDGSYDWTLTSTYPGFTSRSGLDESSMSESHLNLIFQSTFDYTLTLFDPTGTCPRDTTISISVLPPPTNLSLVATGGNQVCAGSEVDFVASATNASSGSSTYNWFVNSNPVVVADPTSNLFQYTPTNGEEVSFSVLNGTCEAILPTPVTMTVYDNPTPIALFDDLNSQNHFCDGQMATLNETSGNANIVSYQYFIAGSPTTIGVASHSWNVGLAQDTQDAYIVVTDNNGCVGTSNVLTINVDVLPNLTETPTPSSTCNGEYMTIHLSGFTGEGAGPWNVEFWNPAHTVEYSIIPSTPVLQIYNAVDVEVDIPYGSNGTHVKLIEVATGCSNF